MDGKLPRPDFEIGAVLSPEVPPVGVSELVIVPEVERLSERDSETELDVETEIDSLFETDTDSETYLPK